MESSNLLRVFPIDITSKSYFISVVATRSTNTFEVLRSTLEKLQIHEDPSLYELYIGEKEDQSTWLLANSDDFPIVLLDSSRRQQDDRDVRTLIRKRTNASVLLSAVMSISSIAADPLCNVQDLCLLDDLSETSMLQMLHARFDEGHIYTYVGLILIAINPYYLYSIYNPKYSNKYQNRRLGELPPHIFAIADDAYNSMLAEKTNQSVIISGESGAGKTESTKFLLHQLMKLSAKFEDMSSLELITLGTGPVLEAFGNAMTVANDNSSRFGKFILVKFKENGGYYGASIEKYLLEKSRIICQAAGERNYHVFYYLLNGASPALKEKLHLLPPNQYHYLGQRSIVPLGGVDEASEYQRLCESLSMFGFVPELQNRMFAVLSAILHIGNVEFEKTEEGDSVLISNPSSIDTISDLLSVCRDTLSKALTTRRSQVGGRDSFVTPYKMDEAIATRDALAKALYGALFDWIVEKVNVSLACGLSWGAHKGNTIGVLDIFGFEVFQSNSFEQFCINYANEQLQQYFNKHIFKLEQDEYKGEGIQWESVVFVDNADCLDLVAKKPTGLLLLLDEECSFPGADDFSLYQKFESQHKSHPCYSSPQMKQKKPVFTISHYASDVTYSIEGFREKNWDLMRQDVIDVLATSKMDLVRALIGLPPYAVHRWHTAMMTVLATFFFKSAGQKQRQKIEVEMNQSAPSALSTDERGRSPTNRSPNPPPGTPERPIPVSGGGSAKGSCEAFPFEYGSPVRTTMIGLRLAKVYDITQGSSEEVTSDQRRPSIANILKQRLLQRSVRSRVEEQKKQERERQVRVAASKYRSHLKSDESRLVAVSSKLHSSSSSSGRRVQTKTVSAQFHISLVTLMEQLEKTQPYFVRCIKSNREKAPKTFDPVLVTRQLRYTGMMETIRIRKSGFSVRMTFDDFYKKYEFLIGKQKQDLPNQIQEFLHSLGFSSTDVQIGKTKVFMRSSQKRILQDHLENKVLSKIVLIQLWVRAKLHRCRFLHLRRSTIILQASTRGWLARKQFSTMQHRVSAAVIVQSFWRAFIARRKYLDVREAAVVLQANWKGRSARKRYVGLLREFRLEKEQAEKERQEQKCLEDLRKKEMEELLREKETEGSKKELKDSRPRTMAEEVNAALLEFDQMLDDHVESETMLLLEHDRSNTSLVGAVTTDDHTHNGHRELSVSPLPASSLHSSSSDLSLTYPTPSSQTPPSYVQSKGNVKGIINQLHRRSVSPSPPTSPSSHKPLPFNTIQSKANVKDLVSQIQQKSLSPSVSPSLSLLPSSKSLASERISRFLEDGKTSRVQTVTRDTALNVGKVKSPFLSDNKRIITPTMKKPLRKSMSHDDILKEVEPCDGQLMNGQDKSHDMEDNTVSQSVSHPEISQCESHDNHVTNEDQMNTSNECGSSSALSGNVSVESTSHDDLLATVSELHNPGVDSESLEVVEPSDQNEVFSDTSDTSKSRRPLRRAGGPMERKVVTRRTPTSSLTSTCNIEGGEGGGGAQLGNNKEELSDDELEMVSLSATPTKGGVRSRSALPSHSQSMNVPNRRQQSQVSTKSRREIRSVGDTCEITKGNDEQQGEGEGERDLSYHQQSSELTMDMSADTYYHLNYQLRHSIDCESSDSVGRSDESSPSSEKDRFVVSKKRWGRKSPMKSLNLKVQRKDNAHPLFSKIHRIGSPMSSGESGSSTPVLGTSPKKHQKSRSRTVLTSSSSTSQYSHSYKTSSVSRGQVCVVCNKTFSGFLKHGSKCVACGLVVHKHCQDRAPVCENVYEPGKLITMATEKVVTKVNELDELTQFLVEKHHMHSLQMSLLSESEYRQIDRVFQMALCEFHASLVSTYSLSLQEESSTKGDETLNLTFEQMVNKFTGIYRSMARREDLLLDACDIAIGVNQIRTFLDEFVKSRRQNVRARTLSNESKSRPRLTKRKKNTEKDSNIKVHKQHRFTLIQFNLITVCDHCSKPILVLEKGEVCEVCSYSCHEGCTKKVTLKCEGKWWRVTAGGTAEGDTSTKAQFGVSLQHILPLNDSNIPVSLEKCLVCIESNGLYTQGIYRKSAGGTSKRAVREALETDPQGADLENFSLHAVAATVTSFFRELPEPLLTKYLHTDFIRATDITDSEELLDTLHRIISGLPEMNHCVFERLVFHLARVAQQHSINKMDPHNLAIIFAPSLLQGHQTLTPQELLTLMPKQTLVLEMIISEQMKKLTATLHGIQSLSSEERRTANRLSRLMAEDGRGKSSTAKKKVTSPIDKGLMTTTTLTTTELTESKEEEKWEERGIDVVGLEEKIELPKDKSEEEEEQKDREVEKKLLTVELKHLQQERAVLTASLPKLEPFSPMDGTPLEFPSSPYSLNYDKTLPCQSGDVRGTGMDEFLKRQSMFAGGTRPPEQPAAATLAKKRFSHNVDTFIHTTTTGNGETKTEQNTTTGTEDELLPDLPSVQVLQPLTKNRVSRPAVVKRRKPTNQHSYNTSNLSHDDILFESPL